MTKVFKEPGKIHAKMWKKIWKTVKRYMGIF